MGLPFGFNLVNRPFFVFTNEKAACEHFNKLMAELALATKNCTFRVLVDGFDKCPNRQHELNVRALKENVREWGDIHSHESVAPMLK